MKIISLLIIFCFLSIIPTFSYTLKGEVTYTVESARAKAFDGVERNINMEPYRQYFKDSNHKENIASLKHKKTKFKDRYITHYSDGGYSVVYKNNLDLSLYYNNQGDLQLVEFTLEEDYPEKDVAYNITGNLERTSLTVSNKEDFLFDKNKKLIAHWIGKYCYNEKGEIISTRK